MKRYLLIISMVLMGMASVQGQSQYQIYPFALCWNTGGVDSTIYRLIYFNAASPGTSKSLGYYDSFGNAVTIGGGTIESGCCAGDTIPINIVNPDFGMDTVIAQFTFNDTTVVQIDTVLVFITSNDTTFFAIDTLIVNVTSMDTVIVFSNDTIINIHYDTTIIENNIIVSDTTIVFSNDTVINITYDTSFCINYDTTIVIIDCDGGDLDSIVDFTIDCAEGIFTIEIESGVTYSDTLNCLPDFLTLFFLTDSTTTYTVDASDTVIVSNGLSLDAVTGKDIELGGILDENTTILADSFSFTINQANQAYAQTNEFAWTLFKQFPRDSFSWRLYSLGSESNRAVVGTSEGMAAMYATNPTNEQNGFVALPDATWIFADNGLHIMAPRTDSTGLITIDTSMLDIVQPTWLLGIDGDSTVVKWPMDSVGGGGGGGIYSPGSGTIAPGAVASLDANETFTIESSSSEPLLYIEDQNIIAINDPDGDAYIEVGGDVVTVAAPGSLDLTSDTRVYILSDTVIIQPPTSSATPVLKIFEPNPGANYTTITTQNQAANVNYVLPADDGDSGEVLTTDGAGILSWGAGDGDGIYGGSGTIAPGAIATLDTEETFTIDYASGQDAFFVQDEGGVGIIAPDGNSSVSVYDSLLEVLTEGDILIQANQKFTLHTDTIILTSGGVDGVMSIDTNLTPTIQPTWLLGLDADSIVVKWPLDSVGGGGGDGIYGGSGLIAPGAEASLDVGETFSIMYSDGNFAFTADDGNSVNLQSPDNSTDIIIADDIITIDMPQGFMNWQDNKVVVAYDTLRLKSNGAVAPVFKIEEPSGDQAVGFRSPSLTANVNYLLPPDDGDSGEVLTTDGSGTLTWEPGGGSGDVLQGGNSFGTTMTIGTNDNNAFVLETNATSAMTIGTNGNVTLERSFASNSSAADRLVISTNANAAGAAGLGSTIRFQAETSTTADTYQAGISSIWTNATHASRASALSFLLANAGAPSEVARLAPAGNYFLNSTAFGQLSAADASSMLDVVSTSRGARPAPSQTNAQRNAISSPATGLQVYNTDVNALNIYDGQRWTEVDSRQFMILNEDFMSGEVGGTDGTIGELGWIGLTGGGSLGYKTSSVANHPGVLELSTDASTSATPAIYLVGNTQLTTGFKCEIIIKFPTLATVGDDYQSYFGLLDTTGNAVNSVLFQYNRSSSTNWELVRSKNNSSTTTDSGVAVDTGWNRFTVFYNGTNVIYYINGTQVLSTNTNIPTNEGLKPYFWMGKVAGTTPVTMEIDYFNLSQSITR